MRLVMHTFAASPGSATRSSGMRLVMHTFAVTVSVAVLSLTAATSASAEASSTIQPSAEASKTEPEAPAETTEAPVPERVSCEEASEEFILLCEIYDLIAGHYVDTVDDQRLAEAAAQGVRDAGLAPRHNLEDRHALTCVLPAPEFAIVCDEIEAVDNTAEAVWAATNAMVSSLNDPHTQLLTAQQYNALTVESSAGIHYFGIGLKLGLLDGLSPCRQFSKTCRLTVSEVFPNGPAAQAGILVDDVLLRLGDMELLPAEETECGFSLLPEYQSGITVSVKVERDGGELTFDVTPAVVLDPVVANRTVHDNIGYLRIDTFSASTDTLVAQALHDLLSSDIESLVIDLRHNPGGYLNAVVEIAGLFLKDQQTVSRITYKERTETLLADGQGSATDPETLPIVLLVNQSSASASELLTLALRDNGRANVIGTTTYGKNTGQLIRILTSDNGSLLGALNLTVLRWAGPTGVSAKGGIRPDREVDLSTCLHPTGLARQAIAAFNINEALPADIETQTDLSDERNERLEALRTLSVSGLFQDTGCNPGLLCPNEPISRWEAAVWILRFLEGRGPDASTATENRFADVTSDYWWAGYVERLADLGIINGCSNEPKLFCPDEPIKRSQMATMIMRTLQVSHALYMESVTSPSPEFIDMTDHPAATDVIRLFSTGIVKGCSVDPLRFCPKKHLSRAQMALFLYRAYQFHP